MTKNMERTEQDMIENKRAENTGLYDQALSTITVVSVPLSISRV